MAGGSLIAILLWVNFSAQIILYGAEFTHVFSQERRAVKPRKSAQKPVHAVMPVISWL